MSTILTLNVFEDKVQARLGIKNSFRVMDVQCTGIADVKTINGYVMWT